MRHTATDLANFLGCSHLALLDRATKLGGPKPPKYNDPALEVLQLRGLEHEREYEDRLRRSGLEVVRIDAPDMALPRDEYWTRFTAATLDALQRGVDVVVQGGLWDGPGDPHWAGRPDFLRRVDLPAGGWTYEVIDTKLAREAKGAALLQVLLYADLVERIFGVGPEFVHLALGGPVPRVESFRVAEYAAYFRNVRDDYLRFQTEAPQAIPTGPDPVEHCAVCRWRSQCTDERREVDHLSLVAGISGRQRDALRENGVTTLAALASCALPLPRRVDGVTPQGLVKIREQARIQLEGRLAGEPRFELLPMEPELGLSGLPAPSPGDLFFDLEGNPYAFTFGIEYLFGCADADGEYFGRWALNREQEKEAFEAFVDFVMARWGQYPDLHIYHYATYEESALKRLMGFHATREAEVDRILRGGVLVDLHRVVKQSLRASVESYSIKKMEPFYGFERVEDLRDASTALARFDAWLEMGLFADENDEVRRAVEAYNRDDCVSTLRLRNWLEHLRASLETEQGTSLPRPVNPDPDAAEAVQERDAEVALRYDALTAGVPADPIQRSNVDQARWLMAQLLDFHRREKKAFWWEFFRCQNLSPDERIEDSVPLGGLEYMGVVDQVKKSYIHRYAFPPQDHTIKRKGKVLDLDTGKSHGEVVAIDETAMTIDLSRGIASEVPHPNALTPDTVGDKALREAVLRNADSIIELGLEGAHSHGALADLLLRRPPRLRPSAGNHGSSDAPAVTGSDVYDSLVLPGESPLDAACRLATQIDRTVLPIQGPPGAGKTYTGAKMIIRSLEAGKRVGITATSHKVISNLLDAVCIEARASGFPLRGIQKGSEDQGCGHAEIRIAKDAKDVANALQSGEVHLAAGTAWLWSSEDLVSAVDLLFIDEAGQFSLANTVAIAGATESLVLLGDPRQLEQPQQGVHPPGADLSVLDHLLNGSVTVESDRGLFLEETWRLHPAICAFTSEIFYDGRLQSHAGLERQRLHGPPPFEGTGLRIVPVAHAGNQSESPEEAEVVQRLVEHLVQGCTWTDAGGIERQIGLRDILIVAPYNVQVAAIASRLPPGARVGTVDKFQGQEAPVVIYSMASSSAQDAPRGMEFLYSPNRLNVATSRARCLSIIVANPAVFSPTCSRPEQMKMANAFCRYRELAEVWELAGAGREGRPRAGEQLVLI